METVKIKLGASASAKIMAKQYEPIDVSSVIEIERVVPDDDNLKTYILEEQKKLETYVINDTKRKMKTMFEEFSTKRDKLMDYIKEK